MPLENPRILEQCIRHLIYGELEQNKALRPRLPAIIQTLFSPGRRDCALDDVLLGETGLDLDSLAVIAAASSVASFFDLGKTGVDDHFLFEGTTGSWANLVAKHFALLEEDGTVVFQTSGSTDKPRCVRHSLFDLDLEVEALLPTVVPEQTQRIIALVRPQHVYGWLFTILLPAKLKVPVVDATFRGVGSLLNDLKAGDLIVGTPFHWNALVSYSAAIPRGVFGVTSGGAMPADLWSTVLEAGVTRLAEVFGSTETGGIAWRDSSSSPFKLLPHCARNESGIFLVETGKVLPLQDHLDWCNNDTFIPSGRMDRAVQLAGVNVSLEKVRSILLANEFVEEAAVRVEGDHLTAFVVPKDINISAEMLSQRLADHARAYLEAIARPVSYTLGGALPRNDMGKLASW